MIDAALILQAVQRLRDGGLVAFPTETVYGLGADALNPAAIARVFAIKGRPARNPLIIHVGDAQVARRLVSQWPEAAQRLADAFWPGPLTIVLPKASCVPDIATAGAATVALRCPEHPLTLALLRAFGPLVGPSANPSGGVSPTRAEHVREAFGEDEVLVLDGGPCRGGIESTVVTLAEHPPRVLRPGLISAEALSHVLNLPVADAVPARAVAPSSHHADVDNAPLASPGMLDRHYSPTTPARLVDEADLPGLLRETPGRVVVIAHAPLPVWPPHELEPLPGDPRGYAAGLYAALRAADLRDAALIAVLRPQGEENAGTPEERSLWRAILDRLGRACGG